VATRQRKHTSQYQRSPDLGEGAVSDIFLSYASEDLARIRPLVHFLTQQGWSVWWDRTIPLGKTYDQVIDEALKAARCVVVVWSQASVASGWVREEAVEGRERGILVPVMIDSDVRLPLGFRLLQTARLLDWSDLASDPEFTRLVQAITALLGPPPQQTASAPVVSMRPPPQPSPSASDDTSRLVNSLGMTFVRIPAGEFRMGSTDGYDDERPVHTVRISQLFYLGIYAVTQGQWEAVMGNNPSRFTGDPNRPVEQVSWEDVQEFIGRLNAREGRTLYRLPTEAEWEYAARAGSTTAYCFGDDSRRLGEYAWYDENAGGQTHPVGTRQPNAWGLYDMHGNVWEWVQDWYGTYAAEPVTDPQGPASGSGRVARGGGWGGDAGHCRSAFRGYGAPGYRDGYLGFRLLRTAP
jgi:formylglycine-generating enzyme required for sulfatase activity